MSADTSLVIFKAITNFTNDLSEFFSSKQHSLKLYCHLINKTTLAHEAPIKKHIEAFREFCILNRDAISSKDSSLFELNTISYSKRVYINMKEIFDLADRETSSVIWKHILVISALVDPTGKARQILTESVNKGDEADFLKDIITKVEKHVDPNANPMEAISSIMSSGVFNDLVGGMGSGLQDGTLDINKLMGTVQTMVSTISEQNGDPEGGDQAMNMIKTMMGSMQGGAAAGQGEGNAPPALDIAGLLGPMMGALTAGGDGGGGGLPNLSGMLESADTSSSIEAKIEAQLNQAKKNNNFE